MSLNLVSSLKCVATISTTLFVGGAFYINVAGHPATLSFTTDIKSKVLAWSSMYEHAKWFQAKEAFIGAISGITLWKLEDSPRWLYSALLLGSVIPFTILVMKPLVNDPLLQLKERIDRNEEIQSETALSLLQQWGWLHAVRTGLSGAALGILLYPYIIKR